MGALVVQAPKANMRKGNRKVPEERNRDRIEDLKAENRKLRKEVQQLRKHLNRNFQREEELQSLFEEVEIDRHETAATEHKPSCPKCGSKEVEIVEKLRDNIDYYFCQNSACNARGPIK